MAFLASQQELGEVNAEMVKLNAKYQKLLEVCNILFKFKFKTALAQIKLPDSWHIRGKQIAFPIRHPMKIYGFLFLKNSVTPQFCSHLHLAKESWFLILGFVPQSRRRLGQNVP
jgi:hypothetical protein